MRNQLSIAARAASVIALAALALAACTGETPAVSAPELVGWMLDELTERAGPETQILVQDASPRIEREASYRAEQDAGWVIVAACSSDASAFDSDSVEVAVIPSDGFTESVVEDVRDGEWTDAVDCGGREFR